MTSTESPSSSPFFHPGSKATVESLAILHLSRDNLIPTFLHDTPIDAGYAEGHVANTRFGSFPHSTLIDIPWGSQVLASRVDTGSRGRRGNDTHGKKRKIQEVSAAERVAAATDEDDQSEMQQKQAKTPVVAASGFAHLLPPTPETWTISLPHRTQVVYTPDYSHILQKLRVQPGSVMIEAGAGSGSFTHAAARAVFNGYSSTEEPKRQRRGKVYSFEYHEPRAETLQAEIKSHGLSSIVQVTHRDVYTNGFLVPSPSQPTNQNDIADTAAPDTTPISISPNATAVFLDLPAPWLALPHLTRSADSPLNPRLPVHICCFLPCIEQAQKAVSTLRTHGWVEICMHELAHRRIEVRRELVGLGLEGMRGCNPSPATVEEAMQRLIEVEKNARNRSGGNHVVNGQIVDGDGDVIATEDAHGTEPGLMEVKKETRAERLARVAAEAKNRKPWKEGRVVSRTEPEIKTHTSYLIFAVLPVEWTEAEEERCRAKWPPARKDDGGGGESEKKKKGRKER